MHGPAAGIAMRILDHEEGDGAENGKAGASPYVNACARVLLAVRKDDAKEFAAALRDALVLADANEESADDG